MELFQKLLPHLCLETLRQMDICLEVSRRQCICLKLNRKKMHYDALFPTLHFRHVLAVTKQAKHVLVRRSIEFSSIRARTRKIGKLY